METKKVEKKKSTKMLFGLAITTIILALIANLFLTEKPDWEHLARQVLPEATEVVPIRENPMIFEGKNNGNTVGYAVVDKATGYQSDIEIMAGIDLNGEMTEIIIVGHQETPSFFRKITDRDKFFEQFQRRNIIEGFILNQNVDGVSGATVSSKAIVKAVNSGTNMVGSSLLGLEMPKIEVKVDFGAKESIIITLMLLSVFATYKRKAKYRFYVLIFSAVILGFWYNAFVLYSAIASIITGSMPYAPENLSWHILVWGAFLLILFTGKNLFCYWVCPFGASQEILAKIGGGSFKPSQQIEKKARYLPAFLAWLALLLALLKGEPTSAFYEPYSTFFAQVGTNIQWVLLPVVVLSSLFIFRFWCKYFCPVGYIMHLTVRLRSWGGTLWRNRRNRRTISS